MPSFRPTLPQADGRPLQCSRLRRFMHRCAPLLTPAVLAAALGCREPAATPTGPDIEPAPATGAATAALAFNQLSVSIHRTCGVTTDNRAYCWGGNDGGALGTGTS
jgi:hypothetical protein